MEQLAMTRPYYVLSLDGGGSLGVYTLGVLTEIEKMLGQPLHQKFDLVYGTSTGSIIASMIALGDSVDPDICDRYFDLAPAVMGPWSPSGKTEKLRHLGRQIFGDKKFDAFLMDVGIVTTDVEYNRPRIFKQSVTQAHGRIASFESGFDSTILDAVISSCAAYPIFKKSRISVGSHDERELIDGGFVANNPSLFALTDATGPLGIPQDRIRLLSVGTGSYPARRRLAGRFLPNVSAVQTFMTLLKTSTNTVETLRPLLFGSVQTVRVNQAYADRQYETDFIESDTDKLQKIYQLGRKSFEEVEGELAEFFK